MKKNLRNLIVGLILGGIIFSIFYWRTRDYILQIRYDISNENNRVTTRSEIDEILSKLEKVKYQELELEYSSYTKSNEPKFKRLLSNSTYYKVNHKISNQKIVGEFRIKDFMCKDKYYKRSLYDRKFYQNWLINKRLLYRILELQDELEKQGNNKDGFWIRHGHRTPKYNRDVNGADLSRHVRGEAADLVIKDINGDGRYSNLDKQIVLELVDKKIIGNRGGIGRYPGTKTVHIDVRGKRARWDSY